MDEWVPWSILGAIGNLKRKKLKTKPQQTPRKTTTKLDHLKERSICSLYYHLRVHLKCEFPNHGWWLPESFSGVLGRKTSLVKLEKWRRLSVLCGRHIKLPNTCKFKITILFSRNSRKQKLKVHMTAGFATFWDLQGISSLPLPLSGCSRHSLILVHHQNPALVFICPPCPLYLLPFYLKSSSGFLL